MIHVVVLAAGSAVRYGDQKLVVGYRGRPLVRWAVEHALDTTADGVLVVTGREEERVREALDGLPVNFHPNPRHEEGMASSIRAGVGALPEASRGALIVLGDQPHVSAEVMTRVIAAGNRGRPIARPIYRGTPGHPVLFRRPVFPELLALTGDRGARSVVERDPERVARVEIDAPPPRDIDTPADRRELESDLP